VTVDGRTKAYPLDKLRLMGKTTDTFAGRTLRFSFDPVTGDLELTDAEGNRVPYITAYWFVWKGAHPETERHGQTSI
jgi:hypothetical protein